MPYIAVIPARGGSKGIKNKNLQLVGNKSLVARAIIEAKKVDSITRIIVSTDTTDIQNEAKKYGVEVHNRRKLTSSDTAKTIDVMVDIYDDMNIRDDDVCILLQPTSPLRDNTHIQQSIELYEELGLKGSVVTATVCDHHPLKTVIHSSDNTYVPIRNLSDLEAPRQQLPKALRINGAVYITSFESILANRSFFTEPLGFIEMPERESIDIDTPADLAKANLLIKGKQL